MATPETLGHYQVQRVLGKGAMGVVYEGLDARLHRRVAIKTIQKTDFGDWSAHEFTARFLREARAVARLNHPNIVQVYDFGEDENVSFIVMEYIDGKDLKAHFEDSGRFEIRNALRIMCELLDALDFAHTAGVVHRDIKPANVMLDVQSRTKLTDFGVARLTDQDRSLLDSTQVGTMVGTPAYMSPEQVLGQKIDGRSDIFSSGVLLYEFLTGKKPFEGGAFTLAKMIIEADPPPPSSLERSISPELDRIIDRTMAKNPDHRFSTAREAASAIRLFLNRGAAVEFYDGSTVLAPGAFTGASEAPARRAEEPARLPARARTGKPQSNEADLEFWRSIRDSDDHEDLELYIQRFPDGIYVDLAKRKISKLRRNLSGSTLEDSGLRSGQFDEEYWRSIKDSDDPDDLELYIKKFPDGTFAELTKRRLAKLKRGVTDTGSLGSGARTLPDGRASGDRPENHLTTPEAQWRARRTAEDEAKRDVEWRAEEQARRNAEELADRESEARTKREVEEIARRDAEEKARREAEDKRASEENAMREAEEKARCEAEEKARRDVEEDARRAAEKANREAEAKSKQEADEKATREAEGRAQREAEEKARREAEEKAKQAAAVLAALELAREQAEKAKRESEETARREAEAKVRRDAEERARRDAQENVKLEAEQLARREAEADAKRTAAKKAVREAEVKARLYAEQKAKRDAEELARRESQELAARELAKRKAEAPKVAVAETARLEAQARERRESVNKASQGNGKDDNLAQRQPDRQSRSPVLFGVVGVMVVASAVGAYFTLQRSPIPSVQQVPAAPLPPVATDKREPTAGSVAVPVAPAPEVQPQLAVPTPEKSERIAVPRPAPESADPVAKAADRLKRDADKTRRDAAEKISREAAEDKARRDIELQQSLDARRAQTDRASREAEQRQSAELAKRATDEAAKVEGERAKARDELQKAQAELRSRNEELTRQKAEADRQRADSERQKSEMEKEKPRQRVFVPPSM